MAISNRDSNKILLFAAVLCCCVTVALAGSAVWQHGVSGSRHDDAVKHQSTAALFQQGEAEGTTAGQLLQQYVETGDQALLTQINDHTAAGINKLTQAVQQSGISGQAFLDGGTQLVQAEGQIIALRQSGDVQAAAAGLQQLSTQFDAFLATQNEVIASEQAAAASAQNKSDQAGDAVSWLIVGSALFATGAVASGVLFVFRSSSRRRGMDALPSA